jgi:hypothetical protein
MQRSALVGGVDRAEKPSAVSTFCGPGVTPWAICAAVTAAVGAKLVPAGPPTAVRTDVS